MNKVRYYGFTLIEILIVLSIIFIVVSISLPSFTNCLSSVKVKGTGLIMMENAQFLERWKSSNGTYQAENGGCPKLPFKFFPENKTDAAYYIDSQKSTCYADRYTIRARPICNKSKRENGKDSCLCLRSGDSLNDSANLECMNGKGVCDCIYLK